MTETPTFTAALSCWCGDDQAHEVARMIGAGMDQIEASRLVFGAEPRFGDHPAAWSHWVRREVRERFAGLRAVVGL